MFTKRNPISVAAAIEKVMQAVDPTPTEVVSLSEAYGRIVREPIIAKHDVPPFHRSAYDGFAIRAADSDGASADNRKSFQVIDEIGAGFVSEKHLAQGEAIRVMTGAMLPSGADAVVMLEQTVAEESKISIQKTFEKYENISLQGEDANKGEQLMEAGSMITPGVIALLATFGYSCVKVGKKPVIGIISTGTELLGVDEELVPGKIRDSNGPMMESQLKRMGIESRFYGIRSDYLEECLQTVATAMEETDCLITTGGVSVGDFDYLPAVYEHLGADVLFNKIAMRPGSVTTFAVAKGKCLFGLSGNPSACYTGFELFVRPALLKMMGSNKPYLPYAKAVLKEDFLQPNPFTRFIRATYEATPKGTYVSSAGFNKTNAVTSIARGNAFIVLTGGTKSWKAGDEVDVLLLGIEEGSAEWVL